MAFRSVVASFWEWCQRTITIMSHHQSQDQTLELILQRLDKLSTRLDQSFNRLDAEVREIKDSRFRPFFATGGAFLAITVSVMSYIYSLEVRLRGDMFRLTELVHDVEQQASVNSERLVVTNQRLEMRSQNQVQTWETHTNRHDGIDRGLRIIVEKMIDREARLSDEGED